MASTTRTKLDTILSGACGAIAAAATIALLQSEPPATSGEQARREPARAEAARAIGASDLDRARLDRVERELVLLKQGAPRAAAGGAEAALAPTDADELAPPLDPEQEYAEQQAIKQDWLTRHTMEAVDTSWARGAEREIDLDLDRLRQLEWAGRGAIDFEIVDVSCRTSLCVAAVEWGSARTAVEKGAYLAMHDYAQSCTVTVFGPSPEEMDQEGPFLQEVFFDCA